MNRRKNGNNSGGISEEKNISSKQRKRDPKNWTKNYLLLYLNE